MNSTFKAWAEAGRPPTGQRPGEDDVIAHDAEGWPIVRYASSSAAAGATGEIEALSLWAGQGVGLIDGVKSARAIIEETVTDAAATLAALAAD